MTKAQQCCNVADVRGFTQKAQKRRETVLQELRKAGWRFAHVDGISDKARKRPDTMLLDLARRVSAMPPSHRNFELFHEERSDIAHILHMLAMNVRL